LRYLKESNDTGNWKRNHWIALLGEPAVEEFMDLWEDRHRVIEFFKY